MTPPSAKVIVLHAGHVAGTKAADVASAKASDVIAAHRSDVATAKSAHVATAKSAHVATAKAAHVAAATATHMATTTTATATAAGLCTRGNKAAGKQCTCQNHHRSSSHNILHLDGRTFRHRALSDVGGSQQGKRQRRDGLEMGMAVLRLY
jgi:hypothetical protein